jgi:hypothetical protein
MNLTYAETIDADPPITIEIYTDPDPEAPDNTESDIFIITTRNRHFELAHEGFTIDSAADPDVHMEYDVFKVYAYIHSGVQLSLTPFSCPWDSGPIGYLFARKGDAASPESFIKAWNDFLSGNVYGFVVESGGVQIDSCWGFYSDYNTSGCLSEARASAARELASRAACAQLTTT